MQVHVLRQYHPDYCIDDKAIAYYASRRKAEAKAVELSTRQAKEEELDWIANPCECGERDCYLRDKFFYKWSVENLDLVELSMRELMKIELADADENEFSS
jgi:hypothetical protein